MIAEGRGFLGCGKTPPSCLSERSEESRSEYLQSGARCLAEFTLSQLQRFFASLRMTSEGLGMTLDATLSRTDACDGILFMEV